MRFLIGQTKILWKLPVCMQFVNLCMQLGSLYTNKGSINVRPSYFQYFPTCINGNLCQRHIESAIFCRTISATLTATSP